MTRRFRCAIGKHRRATVMVTLEVWPMHHGYFKVVCPDCGKVVDR